MGAVVKLNRHLGEGVSTDTWENMGESYTLIAVRTRSGLKFGFNEHTQYAEFVEKLTELTQARVEFKVTYHDRGRFRYEG